MSGFLSRLFGPKEPRQKESETKEYKEPRPSLPPSAAPKKEEEIRLSEYHFSGSIQALWEQYKQVVKTAEQGAIQPRKETALTELSTAFLQQYSKAPPDRNAEDYFNDEGHPAEFMALLCKEFALCTPKIGNELMEVFENVRALRYPFGLTLIQLLAVATKYRPNRINLARCGFVKVVVDVTQTVCGRYQTVRQDSAIQSCEWAPQFHQYLLDMLLSVLRVCVNFTDPHESWKQDTVPAPRHSPLDGTGILHIVAGLLPTFHGRAASDLQDFELQLLDALLGALAAFVHGNHSMQTAFNSCHGVDILLRFLGWPGNWRREQAGETADVTNLKYYKEFELRLTCLRVLRCAVHNNSEILDAIVKSNGFDKIIEFMLWVFMTCSEESSDMPDIQRKVDFALTSEDHSYKGEPFPLFRVLQDTPEFDKLFELLFAICALPMPYLDCFVLDAILGLFHKDEANVEPTRSKDQKTLWTKSPYNNLARRRMHFGHVKSGYGIRFPLLQQYTLHFFYRIVAIKPHLVQFVREYAHATFFDQFFFFLGEMNDDQPEIPLTEADVLLRAGVCRLLRLEVLQFLQFVATRDESPNLDECRFLMACLSQRWDDHELVSMVCRCTARILQSHRPKTQICLLKASASKTLSRVIRCHRDLAKTESSEEFLKARVDVLVLLDEFLSTANIKLQVLLEQDTVNIIFALIHEPPPMRNYGIKFITELMVLVGQNFQLASANAKLEADGKNVVQIDVDLNSNPGLCMEGLQDAQKTLFTQYVELLPQVMHDIDLVFDLLAGIRNVVSVDPSYQDIFRKRQTFTHIVNFLSHLVPSNEDIGGQGVTTTNDTDRRLDFAASPSKLNHHTPHQSEPSLSMSNPSSSSFASAASSSLLAASSLAGPLAVSRSASVFHSCVTPTVHSMSYHFPFPSHPASSSSASSRDSSSSSSASSLAITSVKPNVLAVSTGTVSSSTISSSSSVTATALSENPPVKFHISPVHSEPSPLPSPNGDYLSSPSPFPTSLLQSPAFSPTHDDMNHETITTTSVTPRSSVLLPTDNAILPDTLNVPPTFATADENYSLSPSNCSSMPSLSPATTGVSDHTSTSKTPSSPSSTARSSTPPTSALTEATLAELCDNLSALPSSPLTTSWLSANAATLALLPLSISATLSDAIAPPLSHTSNSPSNETPSTIPLSVSLSCELPPFPFQASNQPPNQPPHQSQQQQQQSHQALAKPPRSTSKPSSSKFSFASHESSLTANTKLTPPSTPRSPPSFLSPSPGSMYDTPRDSFVEHEHFTLGVSQYGRPKGKATREFGMTLCIEVLKTLNELMRGNKRVQDHFKQDIGYDYLGELLLRAEHSVPSRELFDALFCMLLETEWPPEEAGGYYLIKNQGVLNLMLQLLAKCKLDHQLEFLDTLTSLVEQCPLNQTFCCKAHVIDSLLELFRTLQKTRESGDAEGKLDTLQKKVIDLIKLLGTYSISVKQLKRFFGLLKNQTAKLHLPSEGFSDESTPTIELRPTYGPQLLRAIEEMTQKDGPANFFYLDGICSGLELPPIEAWPIARGFSFSTWVRIESLETMMDANAYQPRLFHFMTGESNPVGLEAFFVDQQLVVEVTLRPGSPQAVTVEGYIFPIQKWFHLVITHTAPPTFGQSELKVYVNGELVFTSPTLKYPVITEQLTHCYIGTDDKDSLNALAGQLGPIYMFSDALTLRHVQIMYNLDPGYMSPFSDDAIPSQESRPSTSRNSRRAGFRQLKTGLSSRIFLAYNAKARDGPLFLNNTPRAPSSGKKKAMHANSLPGTHQCVTRHVKDVITCLGGIQVLLPLFAQVDLPTRKGHELSSGHNIMRRRYSLEVHSPQQALSSTCEAELADFSYEPDPEFFVNILRVFCVMIERNVENQHWMQKNKAFSVIGVQLEKISPLHFTLDALEALDKLSQATADDERLLEDLFFGILARMKLWIYTPPEVQRRWLIMIGRLVTEYPFLLQRENGQLVWRSLQAVCWYEKQADSQAPNLRLYHRITHAVIGQRPEIEMLECIRQTFLSLFQVVWSNGVTSEEVGMMLTFLQACQDERQKIGVLQEVLWLMDNKATSGLFLRCLTDLGADAPRPLEAPGFFVFLDLLSSPIIEIRVLALRGVERIFRNPDARLDAKTERSLCVAVGDILKRVEHHLTEQTYFILCSIMSQKKIDLHNYDIHTITNSFKRLPDTTKAEHKTGDLRPGILPIIFSLMPPTSSDAHQNLFLETVLKDQLSSFDNAKYKSSIIDQPGWQTWFFDLMLARVMGEQTPTKESAPLPPGSFVLHGSLSSDLEEDTVCVYARSFFVSVLFHALAKSAKIVEKSLAILATYVYPVGEEKDGTGPVLSVEEPPEIVLGANEIGDGLAPLESEEKVSQNQSVEPLDPSEFLEHAPTPLPVLRVWLHVLEEVYKLLVQQDKTSQYDMGTLVVNCKFLLDQSQDMLLSRVNAAVVGSDTDSAGLESVWPIVRVMAQIRKWVMEHWEAWAPDVTPVPLGNYGSSGFAQAFSGTLSRKSSKLMLRQTVDASPGVRPKHSGPESLMYVVLRVLLVAYPIARVQGASQTIHGIPPAANILFNSKHTLVLVDLLASLLEAEADKLSAPFLFIVYTFLRQLCTMLCKLHASQAPFGGVQVLPSPLSAATSSEHLCVLIVELLRVIHKMDGPDPDAMEHESEEGNWEEETGKAAEPQEEAKRNLTFELGQQGNVVADASNRLRRGSRGGAEDSVHRQRGDSASSMADDSQKVTSVSVQEGSALESLVPNIKIPLTPFVLLQSPLRHPESSLSVQQWHAQCIEFLVQAPEWRTCRIELGQSTEKTANKQQKAQQDRIESFDKLVKIQQTELLKAKRSKRRLCLEMQSYGKLVAKYHAQQEAETAELYTEAQKKERQSSTSLWRTFYRALTNERGPWSQCLDQPGEQRPPVYWKVDDCETHQRMRPKLKINYAGVDHKEASQNIPEAGEADSEEKNEQTLRELLGSISKSVVITDDQAGEQKQLGEVVEEETEEIEAVELFNQDAQDEKELIKCDCTMVNPMNCIAGKIRVTTRYLYFDANPDHQLPTGKYSPEKGEIREKLTTLLESICETRYNVRWPLIEIRALHYRRYQLRQNAMELFFEDQNSTFFHFPTKEDRNTVHRITASYVRALRKSRQSKQQTRAAKRQEEEYSFNYTYSETRATTGADVLRRSHLTQAWKQRKISNFDYLMHLNTLAGRTYKDLTQYPVFPWVLSNYESETLDLNDPSNYRDLSKPMGAQDERRLKMYIERYQSLDEDATMKKFHYGTHYSSAGTVLFFLIRIEPFTTLSIILQDGKFDHPDRMFHSIPQTWRGCLTNPADVKELIPEWFYLPELFKNTNGLVLGSKQQGESIGDVLLPPWAKTPEEFVRINRAALESEYVSKNLHKWVDLIFGEKQKGPKAVEAHNVFFYLTYEGSVNIDSIEDTTLREATLAQIEHFGQTPSQLLTTPHPARLQHEDLNTSIFTRFNELHLYRSEKVTLDAPPNDNPLLFIQHCHERIVMVGLDRMVGLHKWRNSTPEYVPPFSFEVESGRANKRRRIGVHFAVGLHILPFFFALSACERYIFSCGHWDNSFRCSNLETGDLEASISTHKDIVTCMAISLTGDILVTGSKDTTVMVWELDAANSYSYDGDEADCFISDKPKHILYGHDDEVTCVAVNRDLDMVVSGSMDGSCIVHTIRKGEYVRSIKPPEEHPLRWVGVSSTGNIVTYSLVDRMLHCYSINGKHLADASASERLYTMMFSENGEFLVTGGDRGVVQIRTTHNLKVAHRFNKAEGTIRSLACTPNEQHLLVGLQTGHVQIYALNATFLRKRFLRRLANLGF